jgi:hypothetical protein
MLLAHCQKIENYLSAIEEAIANENRMSNKTYCATEDIKLGWF